MVDTPAMTVPAADRGRRSRLTDREAAAGGLLLALFICSLFIPIYFHLGTLRLSPSRVFLLAAFVPLFLRWITGAAGRISAADVLILLHCIWVGLALFVAHGVTRIPFAGVTILELFGGYLIGRTLIRSAADYKAFFRYLLVWLAVFSPLVVVELLTERMLVSDVLGRIFETFPRPINHEPRLGLHRAQAAFEHPIVFGVFCSLGVANVFYIYRESIAKRLGATGLTVFMTFASLSSGPLLSAMVQFGLIAWGWMTRGRWIPLIVIAAVAYVAIDLASNRTPITILIHYVTFDPHNAWYRIAIWDWGSLNVRNSPLFGIGLNDWVRASWMYSSTIDNFWLVTAIRYGIPGLLLLVWGIAAILFLVVRQSGLPEEVARYRRGYVIALVGLVVTLSTVHIWGPTSIFVMSYLGAGAWFFTASHGEPAAEASPDRKLDRRPPLTRRRMPNPARESRPAADVATGAAQDRPRASSLRRRRMPYTRSSGPAPRNR